MAIKLKVNKDFAPCPGVDGDEMFSNGIFVFNITKVIEYLQENSGTISNEFWICFWMQSFRGSRIANDRLDNNR